MLDRAEIVPRRGHASRIGERGWLVHTLTRRRLPQLGDAGTQIERGLMKHLSRNPLLIRSQTVHARTRPHDAGCEPVLQRVHTLRSVLGVRVEPVATWL